MKIPRLHQFWRPGTLIPWLCCLAFATSLQAKAPDPARTGDPASLGSMLYFLEQSSLPAIAYWQKIDCRSADVRLGKTGSHRSGLATFILEPGGTLFLRMKAARKLRVSSPQTMLNRDDLEVFRSNGSGFFSQQDWREEGEGGALLVDPPADGEEYLYWIRRPSHHRGAATLNLFSDRTVSPPPAALREEITLPGRQVEMQGSTADSLPLSLMPALEVSTVKVRGPATMVLEHQLLYPGETGGRRAEYRLETSLRDSQLQRQQVQEFVSLPDQHGLLTVDGAAVIAGRLQRSLLTIPKGEYSLTLRPSRTLAARLLREQRPAYLFEKINGPAPRTASTYLYSSTILSPEPAWNLQGIQGSPPGGGIFTADRLLQTARRMAVDNHFQPGGLTAGLLAEQAAAAGRQGQSAGNGIAEPPPNTFFRNLLPWDKFDSTAQRSTWFINPRLRTDLDRQLVVGAQNQSEMFAQLGSAAFIALPSARATGADSTGSEGKEVVQYRLPPRSAESRLRLIALYPDEETELQLTTDDGRSYHLLLTTMPDYPTEDYRLDLAEAGLAILQQRFPHHDRGTLGGPFSLYQDPGPLQKAAIAEIPLPQGVQAFQVKRLVGGGQPVWLALQYRDAQFHTLAETDFLQALQLAGGRKQLLRLFCGWFNGRTRLNDHTPGGSLLSLALQDLGNDYFPLITSLQSLARTFSGNLTGPPDDTGPPVGPLDEQQKIRRIATAETAERQGQWLVALENWAEIRRQSHGQLKIRATMAHCQSLEKLGEHYLAELQLKGLYLHPAGPEGTELARRAYARLADIYKAGRQDETLLGLYATEFSRTFNPDLLAPFAALLLENGDQRQALLMSLLHPQADKTAPVLLHAALSLKWSSLYRETLKHLNSDQEQEYFQALELLQVGRDDEAEAMLARTGEAGKVLLQARAKARMIAAMLKDGKLDEAARHWQQWQTDYPGPFLWTEGPTMIRDYAGAGLLYSQTRHLYGQYHRADRQKPVTMEVIGPAELRFTLHPLHGPAGDIPLTDWVELSDGERRELKPISNNFPSETLRLIGQDTGAVGQRETFVYHVAAGHHVLQIRGLKAPLLVKVERKQALHGCDILPPLTAETFAAMQHHPLPETGPLSAANGITCQPDDCLQAVSENQVLTGSQRRVQQQTSRLAAPLADSANELTAPSNMSIPPKALQKMAHDCVAESLQDREHCLAILARYAEIAPPKEKEWLTTQAMRIYLQNPGQAELAALIQRDSLAGGWQQVELLRTEEGLHFASSAGWQPVSPCLRIRKTMLPALEKDEEILHNQNRLIYARTTQKALTMTVQLRLAEIPYLPSAPLKVGIELDGRPLRICSLDHRQRQETIHFQASPGEHRLIFSLQARYVNQYLAIRVLDTTETDGGEDDLQQRQSLALQERAYFVASRRHPIRTDIYGPALLRVDELRDENIYTSYRYVEEGWQGIEIRPDAEREQGLFRIYRWSPQEREAGNVTLMRPPPVGTEGLPAMPRIRPDSALLQLQSPREDSMEIWAGRGSWELAGTLVRRRDLEDDADSEDLENIQESAIRHRLHSETHSIYLESQAFWRIREHGGPVAGWQEDLTWYPTAFPATVHMAADLFLQNPETASSSFTWPSDEYSLRLRASLSRQYDLGLKSYHLPSLSFFRRFLSMEDTGAYPQNSVDQDIFTNYKLDHPDGIRLADTLRYKPWLDTVWFAAISLESNAWPDSYIPDKTRTGIGWQQLIGDLQADLTYSGTVYFDDRNRDGASYRDALQLNLSWDLWLSRRQRLQVTGMLRHDFDHHDQTGFVSLSFHYNDTPGYRHYRPGDIDFKDLRTFRQQRQFFSGQEKKLP